MKEWMLIGLMAAATPALAQTGYLAQNEKELARQDAERARTDASQAKDEQKVRAELEDARKRLDEAARQVAELSAQLGRNEGRNFVFVGGSGPERRAVLGVQIDPE